MPNKFIALLVLAFSLSAIGGFTLPSYYNSLSAPISSTVVLSSAVLGVSPEPINTSKVVTAKLQLEILDAHNPPTYIADYLSCQKISPTKEFGILTQADSGQLEYKCPKSLEHYGCKKYDPDARWPRETLIWRGQKLTEKQYKIEYADWLKKKLSADEVAEVVSEIKYKDGWSCNTLFVGGREDFSCSYNLMTPVEDLGLDYIKKNIIDTISYPSGCIMVLNKNLTQSELALLQNYQSDQPRSIQILVDDIKYISKDMIKLSKSIQKYIDCPTKFVKNHFGAFVVEDGVETYQCPPEIQTLGCRVRISYLQLPSKPSPLLFDEQNNPLYPEDVDIKNIISQLKTGWNCDLLFPLGSISDGGATCAANKIADYIIEYAADQTCYAIPKSIL